MNTLIHFFYTPTGLVVAGYAGMVVSDAVNLLPDPLPTSRWYRWFFGLAHLAVAHFSQFKMNLPSVSLVRWEAAPPAPPVAPHAK